MLSQSLNHVLLVSIHASARDATSIGKAWKAAEKFQSTRPRGTRRATDNEAIRKISVSIHASARDATQDASAFIKGQCVSIHASARDATQVFRHVSPTDGFNPRVREGRDTRGDESALGGSVSIHASARDATRSTLLNLSSWLRFNPRVREGRDSLSPSI